MACKITVIQKPTYTHFIIEGENTKENSIEYIEKIYGECVANSYKRILIEERLEGTLLDTMDVYDIVSMASKLGLGFFSAIAYVILYPDNNAMKFVENLAVNRSLPVRSFTSLEKAESWLTKKK